MQIGALTPIVALLLAGCVMPSPDLTAKSAASVGETLPPPSILFAESAQGHAIVVLGVECCNYTWTLVDIQSGGDDGCGVHASSSGPVMAGELIQALLPSAEAQCSYSVAYDGVILGDFLFAPDAQVDAPVTVTQTVTQAPPSNDTQPQGNGTVPP